MNAVRVLISGRVQGVNFRWATARQATSLGVSGWVRNLPDGRVEALLEGDEAAVQDMVRWLHTGPPSARVDEVVTDTVPASGLEGFDVTG